MAIVTKAMLEKMLTKERVVNHTLTEEFASQSRALKDVTKSLNALKDSAKDSANTFIKLRQSLKTYKAIKYPQINTSFNSGLYPEVEAKTEEELFLNHLSEVIN